MFRKILILLALVGSVVAFLGYQKYREVFAPNVPATLAETHLYIPTGANFEEVRRLLTEGGYLIDPASFEWLAERMNYKKSEMRSGRFEIQAGWSNRQLIGHLRGGKQATVKVVLNNERLISDIAGKVARSIEPDSQAIYRLLSDPEFLDRKGYTEEHLLSLFIPNTYDFFWNTTPVQFFERMEKEKQRFWEQNNRLQKAEQRDMSPTEVYTLASIVERESNQREERPTIAGVYLNRLERDIPLQADPTVVFATKQFDLRRVLKKHLAFESPYNTYLNAGLPPGPISMASINSIDAVLDAEDHEYLFFCAKPGKVGYHAFAKTLAGHNANARKYHRWLNQRRVR